jgi:NADP-dependent 3-hydroxy acid dehydrogenase YdfG
VFIFGRHPNLLEDTLADIKRITKREALGVTADVADYDSVKRVFANINDRWGGLDVLVNNAALPARSIIESDSEYIQYIVNVNITGYLLCSKLALESMLPRRSGHIINVGSMSAEIREGGDDLYVSTKSAISGLSESLRKMVNHRGVKVTLIKPGSVGTNMANESHQQQEKKEADKEMLKAEDIAECILFALNRPSRCDIFEIKVKPSRQII